MESGKISPLLGPVSIHLLFGCIVLLVLMPIFLSLKKDCTKIKNESHTYLVSTARELEAQTSAIHPLMLQIVFSDLFELAHKHGRSSSKTAISDRLRELVPHLLSDDIYFIRFSSNKRGFTDGTIEVMYSDGRYEAEAAALEQSGINYQLAKELTSEPLYSARYWLSIESMVHKKDQFNVIVPVKLDGRTIGAVVRKTLNEDWADSPVLFPLCSTQELNPTDN